MKVVFNSSNISMKKQVNSKIGSYKTSSYKDVPKMVYIKTGVIYDMMISTIFFFILNDLTSAKPLPGWWRYYGWFENHQQS